MGEPGSGQEARVPVEVKLPPDEPSKITYGLWLRETVQALEKAGWDVKDFGGFPLVECEGADEKKLTKLLNTNLPRGGIKNILPGKILITPMSIEDLKRLIPSGKMEPKL